MKTEQQIDYIYKQLGKYWPRYANKKPAAKIYKEAYTSLIGVMLSAQSQDKRTAIACKQLFALADTPEKILQEYEVYLSTDCKSRFDALARVGSSGLQLTEKRTAIEVLRTRERSRVRSVQA